MRYLSRCTYSSLQMEYSENQPESTNSIQTINLLERLLKTKPIWFLPDVTREESSKLLHNKKPGVSTSFINILLKWNVLQNFLIRGSRQPNTLAISIKLGSRLSCQVQHFIIIQKERKVCLEDSDLQFDNIVSLAFHYSQVW